MNALTPSVKRIWVRTEVELWSEMVLFSQAGAGDGAWGEGDEEMMMGAWGEKNLVIGYFLEVYRQ